VSAKYPYINGNMALPHKPIIIIDAPSFVKRPKPSKANGHIPAQTKEFASPNNTTNHIDISVVWLNSLTSPLAKIISKVNIVPNKVHNLSAFTWFIRRGIQIIPSV